MNIPIHVCIMHGYIHLLLDVGHLLLLNNAKSLSVSKSAIG